MTKLGHLKPCRERHAVKEAVLTVFAKSPISDFQKFGELMQSGMSTYFKKFEVVNQAQFSISIDNKSAPNFNSTPLTENGFKFLDIEDGKTVRVFQGLNEDGRSYFSFHELNYTRWNNFRETFESCIKQLQKVKDNIEVSAYSLHVIDEFDWTDSSPIPYNEIFRLNNKLIPTLFTESETVDFLLSRNIPGSKESNSNGIERIQVLGQSTRSAVGSKLVISHNLTEVLNDAEDVFPLIQAPSFTSIVNKAHELNKAMIKDLLNEEVLGIIEFNKH